MAGASNIQAEDLELDKLSDEEFQELYSQAREVYDKARKRLGFASFQPLYFQKEWFKVARERSHKDEILVLANQQGKTTAGALITTARCIGAWPESISGAPLPDRWVRGSKRGERYLAAGETFEVSLRDTIVPKLLEFITPDMLMGTPRKNAQGIPIVWKFVTGAELVLMSYQQVIDSFEGAVWDGVWFDEPPPQDVYNAVRRGTLSRKAPILITATPLKEPWMLDDLILPSQDPNSETHGTVAVFHGDIWQNAVSRGGVIPDDEIRTFLANLPERERQARELGLFKDIQGLEFPYVDEENHVVPEFTVPAFWPMVEVCDPAMKRGLYVCWFVCDPDDYWYCVQAKRIENGSFQEMHQSLQRWRDVLGRMPDVYIMDQRGGAHEINKDLQTTWFDEFRKAGTRYEPSKEVAMETLHGWMRPAWDPRKEKFIPKLRVTTRVAAEKDGPIWAFRRFQWEPLASRKRRYTQPGKDWVDDFRYLAGHPGMKFQRLARNPELGKSIPGLAASYAPPPNRSRQSQMLFPGWRRSRRPTYRMRGLR